MKVSKRRVHILVFSVTTICALLVAAVMLYPEPEVPSSEIEDAIEKAIPVFDEGSGDPYAFLFLDVLYRRFGIIDFADSLERYDQVEPVVESDKSLLRLFRRIADYDTPWSIEDFTAVTSVYDMITLPALYCDLLGDDGPPPDQYFSMLNSSVYGESYKVTHVLLALIWMQENDCDMELPDGFVEKVYSRNLALIDDEDPTVYDIELEAAAFLCLAGQRDLIDNKFVRLVIDQQREDGSWGVTGDKTDDRWHTTVLGLTFLLHLEYPSDSYPPSLAPASP